MADQALEPTSEANIEDPASLIDKDFGIGGGFSLSGSPFQPKKQPAEADDPYEAIMRKETLPDTGLDERARLNAVDGWARGTLAGAAAMRTLKAVIDDEKVDAATRSKASATYNSFNNDLIRYDLLRSYEGPMEGAAAFAGQVYGSLFSPESWVIRVPGLGKLFGSAGGRAVARIGEGAVTQAALQGITDPVVQALSVGAETQKEFSQARTAAAIGLGAAIGGGGAAIGVALEKWLGKKAADAATLVSDDLQKEIDLIEAGRREAAAETPILRRPEDEMRAVEEAPPAIVRVAEPVAATPGGGIEALDPATIQVDASRFQFKAGAGEAGITERLQGVTKWDPRLAGTVLVWRDKQGTNWIADGHQRLGLARRLTEEGQEGIKLNAFVLDAKEGITDADARVIAAAKNIAEGTGTPIDAAKIMREAEAKGIEVPAMPPRSALVKDGHSLARLSQEAFGMAVNEVVPVNQAAIVGRLVTDPGQQLEAMRLLASAIPENVHQAELIVRDMLASGTEEIFKQGGLFGPETIASSVVLERAKIADEALKQIKRDKATFASLVTEAERIQDVGANVLDIEANKLRLSGDEQASQVLTVLASRKGPVSDALTGVARRLKSGELTAAAAGREFVQIVRGAIEEGLGKRSTARGAIPGPTGERGAVAQAPQFGPITDKERAAAPPEIQFEKIGAAVPTPPARPTGITAKEETVLSLQQQGARLADTLDFPLRQGRIEGGAQAAGQYSKQGVVRVRNVAAFETVVHEAGHKIEHGLGADMTALINKHAGELGQMDYDQAKLRPAEGFSNFISKYVLDPAEARRLAPQFHDAFETFVGQRDKPLLDALQSARASYERWTLATAREHLAAILAKPADEGILAAIRADDQPLTVRSYVHKFYTTVFDRNAPVTRATRDLARMIRDATGKSPRLLAADNPEILARAFERAFQAAENDAMLGVARYHGKGREGPSLADAIKYAIDSPGEHGPLRAEKKNLFEQYLIARRAEYLWRKHENRLLPRRPTVLSKEGHQIAIRELEAENPRFAEAAQMVHDYTRQLLRKAYEAGLIEREVYKKLAQEEFYVPFHRDRREKPLVGDTRVAPRTERGPGATAIVRRQTGSDRDIISPLETIISQTVLINRTIAHNDIVKAFVALADRATAAGATGAGRIVEKIPAHRIVGMDVMEAVKAVLKKNGIIDEDADMLLSSITDVFGDNGTLFHMEMAAKAGEPILFYKDGGKLKAVRFIAGKEGLAVYEALTNMPPHVRDFAVITGQLMATVMRAGVVLTPVFLAKNLFRDTVAALIFIRGFAPFILNPFKRGAIGYKEAAEFYKQAGGIAQGGGRYRSVDELAGFGPGEAEKALSRRAIGAGVSAIEKFKLAMESGEKAIRVQAFRAVYEQKLKQGMAPYEAMREAAYAADDLLDFSRYGSRMLMLRRFIPFLNSHLQGIDKARRTFVEPLIRAARGDIVTEAEQEAVKNAKLAWFKAGAIGGAAGYVYGLWAMGYDQYRNAGDRDLASNMVLPGEAVGSSGTFLIPKPFELAFVFNLGEALARAAHSDKRAFEYAYKSAIDLFLNIPIYPPGIKTSVELFSGASTFTGRPIVPESEQDKIPAVQSKASTSALARAIGNSTKDLPLNWQLSPIMIDYALGGYFGTLGRMAGKLSSAISPQAPGQSFEDLLFANQLAKDNSEVYDDIKRRFWDYASRSTGQYARAKGQLADYFEKGQIEEATRYLQLLPGAQQVYAILEEAKNPFKGGPKFKIDEKLLHPMKRAAEAVTSLWPLVGNLTENRLTGMRGEAFPKLSKTKRRMLLNEVQTLQHMEMRNALVMIGESGYENQKIMSTDDQFAVIKAISHEVADDIAARYSEKKIRPEQNIAEIWPLVRQRILADGGDAILSDLAAVAAVDGYAFGQAVRVKKPKPPRPVIKPGAEGFSLQ